MDFRLNNLRDEITLRALQSFELLLDTVDYVPPRYLRKIQKLTYKLFRKQYRFARLAMWQSEPQQSSAEPEPPQTPAQDTAVMKIENAPPEKQIEHVIRLLTAYQKEYPELTERLIEQQEETFTSEEN